MTTTEMVAGREFDALVAEKVMGWRPGAGFASDKYWAFSTDIAAAFLVVERLRTWGEDESFAFQLIENSEHGAPAEWMVRFDRYVVDRYDRSNDDLVPGEYYVAPTLPLAICRAALAAVTS